MWVVNVGITVNSHLEILAAYPSFPALAVGFLSLLFLFFNIMNVLTPGSVHDDSFSNFLKKQMIPHKAEYELCS